MNKYVAQLDVNSADAIKTISLLDPNIICIRAVGSCHSKGIVLAHIVTILTAAQLMAIKCVMNVIPVSETNNE
jgi:hypothetical protein